ncbi:unnamed protein product, partial [Owenia fusiformis]
ARLVYFEKQSLVNMKSVYFMLSSLCMIEVRISGKIVNKDYDVRLTGGNKNEGRVEVYLNGTWGGICKPGWDVKDVRVVCRQLGFHDRNLNAIVGFTWYGRRNQAY